MHDLISRQAAIDTLDPLFEGLAIDKIKALPSAQPEIISTPSYTTSTEEPVEYAPIVRCKECKHRPTLDEDGELNFPTYRCPCQCEDFYYSWMPKDDWFCGNGERKKE